MAIAEEVVMTTNKKLTMIQEVGELLAFTAIKCFFFWGPICGNSEHNRHLCQQQWHHRGNVLNGCGASSNIGVAMIIMLWT
jgi:hypothetical protein